MLNSSGSSGSRVAKDILYTLTIAALTCVLVSAGFRWHHNHFEEEADTSMQDMLREISESGWDSTIIVGTHGSRALGKFCGAHEEACQVHFEGYSFKIGSIQSIRYIHGATAMRLHGGRAMAMYRINDKHDIVVDAVRNEEGKWKIESISRVLD